MLLATAISTISTRNTKLTACATAEWKMRLRFVRKYLARQPCMEFKRATTLLNMAPVRKHLKQSKAQRGHLQTSAGPMKGLSAATGVSPDGNKRKRNSKPGRRQPGQQLRQTRLYLRCTAVACAKAIRLLQLHKISKRFLPAAVHFRSLLAHVMSDMIKLSLQSQELLFADDSPEEGPSQRDQRQEQRKEQGRQQREADALAQQEKIKQMKQKKERRQSWAAAHAGPLLTHGAQTDAGAQPLFADQQTASQVNMNSVTHEMAMHQAFGITRLSHLSTCDRARTPAPTVKMLFMEG